MSVITYEHGEKIQTFKNFWLEICDDEKILEKHFNRNVMMILRLVVRKNHSYIPPEFGNIGLQTIVPIET